MQPRISLATEVRRGLGAGNLVIAGVAACALSLLAPQALRVPMLGGAVAVWLLITVLHVAAHGYFGWRFSRGLECWERGDCARARELLKPAQTAWGQHYDPDGVVRLVLQRMSAA